MNKNFEIVESIKRINKELEKITSIGKDELAALELVQNSMNEKIEEVKNLRLKKY